MPDTLEYGSHAPQKKTPKLPALSFACSMLGVPAIWVGVSIDAQAGGSVPPWLGGVALYCIPAVASAFGLLASLRLSPSSRTRDRVLALLAIILPMIWVCGAMLVIARQ